MIKNYLELDDKEAFRLVQLLNTNLHDKKSFQEADKEFKSEEVDSGRGILVDFHNGIIAGMVQVILKECRFKGHAFVYRMVIFAVDPGNVTAAELLEEAKKLAYEHGARKVLFGSADASVNRMLNNRGIVKLYSSLRMTLEDREIRYPALCLSRLTMENREEYLQINNDAFLRVPNGATLTEKDIDGYLREAREGDFYFLVSADGENIGMLNVYIHDGTGEFDIGLKAAARGKGYGRRLLETAVSFLNEQKAEKIELVVMDSNRIAYEMYKKRGFKESRLINNWFEL